VTRTRAWRWLAGIAATLLLLGALGFVALRVAVAKVPEYADRIRTWVYVQTDMRLEFSELDARLRWFGPEVVLRNARVLDRDGREVAFETREGTVGLDLWNLFRTGELVAGRIRFIGPAVTIVRLPDGRIRLLGQRERPVDRPPFDLDRLPAGRIEVSDATVHFRDLKTGRGPWTLRDLELSLVRERDHVKARATAALPASLGDRLDVEARLTGSLGEPKSLDGRIVLNVERLRVPGIAEFVPEGGGVPLAGDGRIEATVAFDSGTLRQVRTDLDLRGVELRLPTRTLPPVEVTELSKPYRPPGANPLSMPVIDKSTVLRAPDPLPAQVRYARIAGKLRLRHEADDWIFTASDLHLEHSDPANPARAEARFRGHPQSTYTLDLDAAHLRPAEAWPLLAAVPAAAVERWLGLEPSGEIRSVRLHAARERAGSAPRFHVAADLRDLSLKPSGRMPGVSGLTAVLSGTDQRGRIALRAQRAAFALPRMFREPIAVDSAAGDIDWRREEGAWILSSRDLSIANPMTAVNTEFRFQFTRRGVPPELDLDARVDRVDARLVRQVLPLGPLQPRSLAWLDAAFIAGQASNGRLSYHGKLQRDPFGEGGAQMIATADVRDAIVDYFAGFAPVKVREATLEIRNRNLKATVNGGELAGLDLARADLVIDDLKNPVIDVRGNASGDLSSALAYLQKSPLGPSMGRVFMQLGGTGPATYDVSLHLNPRAPEERDYRVTTAVRAATVTLPMLRAPVQNLSGEFEIHNYEARAASLRGTFLDGPFELSVAPGPLGPGVTAAVSMRGHGRVAGARLPAFIGLPDSIRMRGTAEWKLSAGLERRGGAGADWPRWIDVDSDLAGLTIDAPVPFAKTAAEPRATHVRLESGEGNRNDVAIESASARARLSFVDHAGKWELERGMVRFDGSPVSVPAKPGLQIAGDWPDFDLAEWLGLRSSTPGDRRLADYLGPVDVHLERGRVLGFEFRDVTARLRGGPASWAVDVSGPMAEGAISIPHDFAGAQPLALDLRRLVLVDAPGTPGTGSGQADPRTMPAIVAVIDDLTWQTRRLGRVVAEMKREPRGLQFTQLRSIGDGFQVEGHGSWLVEGDGPRTRLELQAKSKDLAAATRALGYSDAVEAEQAKLTASLDWPGGPSADAVAKMNGKVRLELEKGQLRNIKPGAGRMLGLLSVVDLPKRLTLDFRDVTDEGLAFDKVTGDFKLLAGNAYTDNLLLKGTAVDIGVVGRTGLATEDYDQKVVVSGNPSGALTVAGALAAGPVVGAGVLVLSQLFKGQLQGLTRVYYRITGPWSNPSVEKITVAGAESLASETQPP
jgi:uncharacterized protein (TIGR02099 family)